MTSPFKTISATFVVSALIAEQSIAGPPLRDPENFAGALNLYSLEFVEDAPEVVLMDRAYFIKRTEVEGFLTLENAFQSSIGTAVDLSSKAEAVLNLAQLYAANDLYIEALVALEDEDLFGENLRAATFKAFCNIKAGRVRNALQFLEKNSEDPQERALYTIAMVTLGGYKAAISQPVVDREDLPLEIEALYRLSIYEAAVKVEDQPLVDLLRPSLDLSNQAEEIQFLQSLALENDRQRSKMKTIARTAAPALALRAEARLLLTSLEEKQSDRQELFAKANALKLRWRGGIVEQELLEAHAEAAISAGDFVHGLRSLRRLVIDHSLADSAYAAQNRIMELLPQIASPDYGVPPTLAAELVIEYSEYAPLGARGDELIRDLAARLSALDLNGEAAALLEHQVFERLRGANRSIVAADLARLYLLDGDAQESLRVIRTTRIAGLSDDVNAKRRQVEAKALVDTGKPESALALLENTQGREDLILKAKVYWMLEDWGKAATSYASLFSSASDIREDFALRAAVSFQLAEDLDGFEAFRQTARVSIEGTPEMVLIDSLDGIQTSGDGFIKAYKAAFADSESQS